MKLIIYLISLLLFFSLAQPVFADPTSEKVVSPSFGELDPLITNSTGGKNVQTVGDLISRLLPYTLALAGLILFGMLIMGGFEIMTAATDAKKADAGKARITTAVIGFVIIFAAYWITQILEIMTGVSVLK